MPSTESPNFLLQQYLRALADASRARDIERALDIGQEATRRGVEHPNLLGLAAQKYMRAGDAVSAHPLLVRARALGPRNAGVLNDLGLCLIRLGRAREALSVLDDALRWKPGSAQLHFNRALAHEQLGELDQERCELERVVDIEPRHSQALSLLAMLAVDRDDGAAVRDYANRALGVSPGEVPAQIALVSADIAARDFIAARNRLKPLLHNANLDPDNLAMAQTLMGDALDGEGKYEEAFRSYVASSETQRAHYAQAYSGGKAESFRAQTLRLSEYFRAAPPEVWRARNASEPARTHVFLLGFIRSGTTLLGQVLRSHRDIEVMHERDCLEEAVRDFIFPAGGLDRLAAASDEALESYRKSYWRRVRDWGRPMDRQVFVDKSPLATTLLPLISTLFPAAKILFVYRDPRDVVLSCFRRRFAMSRQKYEMLSLDDIAVCYSGVMQLLELYREKFDLDIFDARHERLLADFEAETRRICDYLGVAFDAATMDFAKRARGSNIDAPNSAALACGLSRESENHWRHYAKELVPVMPVLAPTCARFGYPEN